MSKKFEPIKFDIQHFAEEGEKTFTQEEVNDIVKSRVADEKRKKDAEIATLKSAHESEIEAKTQEINQLNESLSGFQDSEKALKKLQKEKDGIESQLNEYIRKEETEAWHTKLKEKGVKEERFEAFTKLFGDEERNDENLDKLVEQYPEWLNKQEETPPPIGAGFDNNVPPNSNDPFLKALNSND